MLNDEVRAPFYCQLAPLSLRRDVWTMHVEMIDRADAVYLPPQLFSRIVESAKRKQRHAYRLSYAHDVGSSFDPDMEDPQSWETELNGTPSRAVRP